MKFVHHTQKPASKVPAQVNYMRLLVECIVPDFVSCFIASNLVSCPAIHTGYETTSNHNTSQDYYNFLRVESLIMKVL